ncbi:hypothetical protein [Shimia sp.]|uniref:hypothetical protein n=1 Tax=Shimia sp. TaxID=1954381 RepID=UPI003BACFFC2
MDRQKQLIKHDPDNGQWGDCYRTCVAIIMGMPAAEVPHFCDGGGHDGAKESQDWLRERGLSHVTIYYTAENDLEKILSTLGHYSPEVPMIVTGMGKRGVNHSVVAVDGQIFCDPATGKADQDALTGPAKGKDGEFWWVEFIAKLPSTQAAA